MNKIQYKAYLNKLDNPKITLKALSDIYREMNNTIESNDESSPLISRYGTVKSTIQKSDYFYEFIIYSKAAKTAQQKSISRSSMPLFITDDLSTMARAINAELFQDIENKTIILSADEYCELFQYHGLEFNNDLTRDFRGIKHVTDLIGTKYLNPSNVIKNAILSTEFRSITSHEHSDKWVVLDTIRQSLPSNHEYPILNEMLNYFEQLLALETETEPIDITADN